MSGSPKRSRASISPRRLAALERVRREQAAKEAQARRERERLERERLEAARQQREAEAQQKLEAEQREATRLEEARKLARRVAVEQQLDPVTAQLTSLLGDEVVMTWCRAEVESVRGLLTDAESALEREFYDRATQHGQEAQEKIDALLSRAEARQLQEEQRRYIVEGMLSVLQRQGFQVGAPDLARPGDFESEVVIRAVRPDRRAITVQVPAQGSVSYEIDGYVKRVETGGDGTTHASCDEAESRLESLHQQLAAEFDITMGELTWQGKDPTRLRKNANDLPSGGGRAHRSQGGQA